MNGCVRELSAEPNCGRMLIIYVDSKWRNVSIALGGKSIFCCCILLKDIKRINHVNIFYSVTIWIIASFLWVLVLESIVVRFDLSSYLVYIYLQQKLQLGWINKTPSIYIVLYTTTHEPSLIYNYPIFINRMP